MDKRKINLQLFAEEQEETPTEEVEETPADAETDELPEFEDTDNSQGDEKEEAENKEKKQKNTNKENAERRIAERQRKEQEKREKEQAEKTRKAEREAYLKGIKRALGDKNPYTDKPIVDDEDLEEYEIMKKLEDEGKDPIDDYADYIKQQKRELKRQEEALKLKESEQIKFVNDGIAEVDSKYGEGSAKKFLSDEDFMEFGKELLDDGARLSTVVEKFLKIQAKIKSEAENKALEKQARKISSPGGLSNNNITKGKSVTEMTDEEFKAFNNSLLNKY